MQARSGTESVLLWSARSRRIWALGVAVFLGPWLAHADTLSPTRPATAIREQLTLVPQLVSPAVEVHPVAPRFRRLPRAFVENRGQVDERAKLYLRSGHQTLWLTERGIVFDLLRGDEARSAAAAPGEPRARRRSLPRERLIFAQDLVDTNPGAVIEPRKVLPGAYNYFLGKDPGRWRVDVRAYAEVVYRQVWDGIDLRLYASGRHLEQEFIVRPGGDPSLIRVAYRGVEGLRIAEDGALVIRTAFGDLRESAPTIYQEIDGRRVAVTGRFKLLGPTSYAFEVGLYERRYALVIDPTLAWATYLGGTASETGGGVVALAVDGAGSTYVTGSTGSLDFPTTPGVLAPGPGGGSADAFLAKLDAAGALVYSTYLGGTGDDVALGIAVDGAGSAYLTGVTSSTDFPTTPGAFQPGFTGSAGASDAFVAKIFANGSSLVYSTYLGGTGEDQGWGIAVDIAGNAYVVGETQSCDFPTTSGVFQPSAIGTNCFNFGPSDLFVTKLDSAGAGLVYSTYLGDDGGVPGIAIDAAGHAYVTGTTQSSTFPTTVGAFQTSFGGGGADAFVTKLNPTATALVYSTFLGGSGHDGAFGQAIAVDSSGNAYVTGSTQSANFPTTTGAFQTSLAGQVAAFVAKLNPFGSGLASSTYLGGSGSDAGTAIVIDDGGAYVVGYTTSTDFPTASAIQSASAGGMDAFAAKISSDATYLAFSTYLGGSGDDTGTGIGISASGDIYVGLITGSPDLPSTGLVFAGATDAYVAKLVAQSADLSVTKFANPSPVLSGSNLTYTLTVQNTGPDQAVGVQFTDAVPAGTTFQSLSPSAGCATPAVNGGGTVSCDLGTLASGASVTFTLVVKVTAPGGSVSNTASVTTLTPDPNTANDSATANTDVTAPGTVSGTVTQGAGGPSPGAAIAGALVIVRNSDSFFEVARGFTNAGGNYAIGGLPPRNYKVSAEATGFGMRYFDNQASGTTANLVPVSAGVTTAGVDFALPGNAGSISGKVTLLDGVTPVPNAAISVRLAGSGGGVLYTASTDANGNYDTRRRLSAGSYIVRVTAAGFPVTYYEGAKSVASATPIAVVANTDTTGIDVKLSPAVGGISGTVTSAATGAPLAGVGVSVYEASTSSFIQGYGTDNAGVYTTGLTLAPGGYKVTAFIAGSETIAYNNKFSAGTGDPVTVTAGATTTGIDLALPPLGGIMGYVRNAADDGAVSGAVVDVWDYGSNALVASGVTAADGSYTIGNLNPLQAYRVRARATSFGRVFFDSKPSAGTADVVTVPAGGTATLDFALGAGGGITGTVVDATTLQPVQGVSVDIIDGASTNFSINNFVNFAPTTDASGNFNTGRNLAPGVYKLRARKVNSGYIQTFHPSGLDLSTAATVTVSAGADTPGVNITMTMGGTITGTIRDRGGGLAVPGGRGGGGGGGGGRGSPLSGWRRAGSSAISASPPTRTETTRSQGSTPASG